MLEKKIDMEIVTNPKISGDSKFISKIVEISCVDFKEKALIINQNNFEEIVFNSKIFNLFEVEWKSLS